MEDPITFAMAPVNTEPQHTILLSYVPATVLESGHVTKQAQTHKHNNPTVLKVPDRKAGLYHEHLFPTKKF